VKGVCETIELQNLIQLEKLIKSLLHNQAIVLGTHEKKGRYNIASNKYKESHPNEKLVTRDKNNFSFNSGKSLMLIDFDGHPKLSNCSISGFRKIMIELFPFLNNVEMLIAPSSSAGVYLPDSEASAHKTSGMHIYILVDNGLNIGNVGERLKYNQWIENIGYHKISKDGKQLERHLFDDMVYSAERLIFEALPVVQDGIKLKDREFYYYAGDVLDTSKIALSANERQRMNDFISADKQGRIPESQAAREKYKQHLINDFVSKNVSKQKAVEYANQILDKEIQILPPILRLKSNKHGYLSVEDVINDIDKYTNDTFIDPLQTRDSNEFRAKVFKNYDGSVIMYSMRHGGTNYILKIKDSDNVIENINKCDDVNNLLTIIDNVKENNNISKNDLLLIKNEYAKKNKELTNINLSNKELNELFAKNSYELKDDGVYYHYEKNGNQLSIKICGYLTIEAITHDNNSRSFGRYLKFKNTLNVINYCYMPMATLIDKSGAAHKELVDKGLYIEYDCFNHVIKYIISASNLSSVQITNKIGWHNDSFVFADKTVGKQDIFYQSNSFNISNPYGELGTLNDWQQNISRYCVGNPLLMFAVSVSFSGGLLKLCDLPIGVGFHIFGASSKGKSTIGHAAASVFGKPTDYMRSWRATSNGLEGIAVAYNDSVLVLDEISQIHPKELGAAIYMLINGAGRSRADKSGDARNTKQWQISVLSNGEKSVITHSTDAEEDINAGQQIRLLNIPLSGKFGAFDSLHELSSGEELTRKLTTSCQKNHGIAGIKWIEGLLSHHENYPQLLEAMTNEFKNEINKHNISLTTQDLRALNSFSVVALAGELSTAFGITKWKPGDATKSAVVCFMQWKSSNVVDEVMYSGIDIENVKILQSMKNFVDVHGMSRFMDISNGYDATKIIHNSAGFKKINKEGQIMYLFNDATFKQAVKGHDLSIAVNILKDAGWLLFDDGRLKKSHSINRRTQKLYTIVIPDFGLDVADRNEYVDYFLPPPLKKCVGWG
jgi:putative DNA primase/helicase